MPAFGPWGIRRFSEAAYTALAEPPLTAEQIAVISEALLKGWPLGSEQFKTALQNKVKRQVLPAKRGRPFKIKVDS